MTIAVTTEGVAVVQPEPNRPVIEEWVKRLESGDYPQTHGTLQRTEPSQWGSEAVGYCCLGVLCDLAVEKGVITVNEDATRNGKVAYDADGYLEFSELPPAVREWAGLPDSNPYVEYDRTADEIEDDYLYQGDYADIEDVPTTSHETLAELNDSMGRTFEDIAQIIRNNYLS